MSNGDRCREAWMGHIDQAGMVDICNKCMSMTLQAKGLV